MKDAEIDRAGQELLKELRERIYCHWITYDGISSDSSSRKWYRFWYRDPIREADYTLLSKAEWILAFLLGREGKE